MTQDGLDFTEPGSARYREAYNALPQLEDAYAALMERDDPEHAIAEALSVIREHDLADRIGIALLHRHFLCEPGQVFVERPYMPDVEEHTGVLVTRPEAADDDIGDIAPHRLALTSDGMIQPLEYTDDEIAVQAARAFEGNTKLRTTLGNYLAATDLDKILGVGVVPKVPQV